MASRTFYEVWVQAPDIAFHASLNGVGLHVERFQVSSEWSQTVNQWIWAGENTFQVLLHVGPRQHGGLESGNAVRCEFRAIVSDGENQESRVLATAEWSYADGMSWPQTLEVRPVLDPPFDSKWEWLQADRLSEVDLHDPSLKIMVEALNSALAGKDYAGLKGMLAAKSRELASAYQIPLDKRLRDQEEFFQDFFSDAKWCMQPIEWGGVIHDLHAQGRLLELMTREGKPLLASGDLAADGNFRLGLYLFRAAGVWRLAR